MKVEVEVEMEVVEEVEVEAEEKGEKGSERDHTFNKSDTEGRLMGSFSRQRATKSRQFSDHSSSDSIAIQSLLAISSFICEFSILINWNNNYNLG